MPGTGTQPRKRKVRVVVTRRRKSSGGVAGTAKAPTRRKKTSYQSAGPYEDKSGWPSGPKPGRNRRKK